jgi:Spy/CpxP family protein refolding chaperone
MAAPGARPGGTNGTVRNGLQFGPVGRWWDDKAVVQAIGLRRDQQKKMDEIFNANKPAILASYKSFQSEQSKLEKIGKDPRADKERLFAAIDAVSQARASLQKATAQMLLQIRQQMDPQQIAKVEQLK